jgi:hypothetical protein
MADLQKVQSGDDLVIPASTYNAFIDAARGYQAGPMQRAGNYQSGQSSTDIIYIKNTCGAARARFEILALGAPLFLPTVAPDEFKNRIVLSGIAPTSSTPPGRFAVLLEPLAINAIGRAQVSGVCPAYVNFAADTDSFANVATGAYNMAGGSSGAAEVLWKETGTGLKWAIVRLGNTVAAAAATASSSIFVARVVSNISGAGYYVREQTIASDGTWSDKAGASNIIAVNLAENGIGPGAAVDVATKVFVMALAGTNSPYTVRYHFDHPVYAKYLS